MRRRTHHSYADPRFELIPLLDVMFFLLTFFMYSMAMMVRAQVLPVKLPHLVAAEVSKDTQIVGLTIDAKGRLFLNQKAIDWPQLEASLKPLTDQPKLPAVYVALDDRPGAVDRGLMLVQLIDRLRKMGIEQFNIVGQPGDKPSTPTAPKTPPAP